MSEVTIISIGLAKWSFRVHGARTDGSVGYRNKLPHDQLLLFLAEQAAQVHSCHGGLCHGL